MILELKKADGCKVVYGGNFMFVVGGDKTLYVSGPDGKANAACKLNDYPTYNVGSSIVYCEEEE